jgi:hypothetical protein
MEIARKIFMGWCNAIDFFGGSLEWEAKYPVWLRRLYIVTWPVAVAVRMTAFLILVFALAVMFALAAAVLWPADKIADLCAYLHEQWHFTPHT